MKKLIMIVALCLGLLLAINVRAEIINSGTCGEYYKLPWTLDDQGVLNITGTGRMKNYSTAPWGKTITSVNV
ncbi:MAG: hypothetical protein IJ157_07280 [Clostridia bacterium]|nr:hypothetical protein [Clostridia bacterium]